MTPGLFGGTNAVNEHTLMETPDGPDLSGGTARASSPRRTSPGSPSRDWTWSGCRSATGRCVGAAVLPAVELLDAAMDWAQTYGIGVLLDMTG